ncbi:T9SS type A sorting domain-containing protein [Fulvivirga sp. M361]|uniref:T9SS type A sorting domain-containing protein n=1 Tax=Fulvivirga sp. M361 TaxID=2594266 RepID=UPI001179DE05|nr:T9SS type A sorting domain-containing protein [Fulvivirga sp. M361]TRX48579.1 T9SS type A sorting domain-containing protein [Fulvivirga sp. M361]
MKSIYKIGLAVTFIAVLPLYLKAQAPRTVIIEPDTLAALNNTINGDTLENGERVDPNTVYILRRNSVYKTNAFILNPGFKLVVRAEEGPGSMPIIQPTPIRGGDAFRAFTLSSDFELDGVYVTNIDDTGGSLNRIFRVNTAATIRLKNCWLDGTSQSVVRFDSPGSSVFIENSIISHVGETFDTGNGRVIDVRGGGAIAADSIVFRNNTIFNIARRLVRHNNNLSSNYIEISNNTLVNSISAIGSFEQTREIKVVNNLFVNPNMEGDTRSANLFSIDAFDSENLYTEAGIDPTRRLEIHHNWFYFDPVITDVWADTVDMPDFYDGDIFEDLVDLNGDLFNDTTAAENALMSEPYTFTGPIKFRNAPRPSEAIVIGVVNDGLTAPSRDDGVSPNWNYATSPFFQVIQGTLSLPWEFPYDFTYDASSLAASSALNGGPVGDPRWVPQVLNDVIVSLDDLMAKTSLFYPNPVTHNYIAFKNASDIKSLQIYALNGLEVKNKEDMISGRIDLSGLPDGMFILKVTNSRNQILNQKIIKK